MPANNKEWSAIELERLKVLYSDPSNSIEDIAKKLNRSINAIKTRVTKEKINRLPPWTQKEVELLRLLYPNPRYSIEYISQKLNRSQQAIRKKATTLRLDRAISKRWSEEEAEALKDFVGDYPLKEVTCQYNRWAEGRGYIKRTENQIASKLCREKLSRRLQYGSDWLDTAAIAAILGGNTRCISDWWQKYKDELKPSKMVDKTKPKARKVIHRRDFAKFLINNPDIVDRYRHRFDALLLMDLFRG